MPIASAGCAGGAKPSRMSVKAFMMRVVATIIQGSPRVPAITMVMVIAANTTKVTGSSPLPSRKHHKMSKEMMTRSVAAIVLPVASPNCPRRAATAPSAKRPMHTTSTPSMRAACPR
jgi:hypothetical protein